MGCHVERYRLAEAHEARDDGREATRWFSEALARAKPGWWRGEA
jgi:hypothetical protein